MKSIGNFFKPFILLIANHPIMFALLALSLIIMFVSWVTLEENPQYNRVKSDPKSH